MRFLASLLAAQATAAVIQPRQTSANTATVDLNVKRGTSPHYASGILYGVPDAPNQIPDTFYTSIGFNYYRGGGAQLDAPARGWIWGLNEYKGRFASTLAQYKTATKYGAKFIILPHDIWGTDRANSSTVWPGDNGDFSDYGRFLDQLFSDMRANNMLNNVIFDIWNEPDLPNVFWQRSQDQYMALYAFSHKHLRAAKGMSAVQISGPSFSGAPTTGNSWWNTWLSLIKENNIIPDQYSWHLESNINDANDDLQTNNATLTGMLSSHGLPSRQVNINEYATFNEQVSSAAAWWISRLERYNTIGVRGNWLSGLQLHDLLASLVSKPNADNNQYKYTDTGYFANGEWQVYKYYASSMSGQRVGTTGSGDRIFDVYSTIGTDNKVRILCGTRLQTGTWYITVNNLQSVGLPAAGNLTIHTFGFVDNGHYGRVDAPTDRGNFPHPYTGGSVTFPVYQTSQDQHTAWAFEFST